MVLEPRPALMSPAADQPMIEPPKVVMIRLWPSRMLSRGIQLDIPGALGDDTGSGRRCRAFDAKGLTAARRKHLDRAAKVGVHPGTAKQGDIALVVRHCRPRPCPGTTRQSPPGPARAPSARRRPGCTTAGGLEFGEVHLTGKHPLLPGRQRRVVGPGLRCHRQTRSARPARRPVHSRSLWRLCQRPGSGFTRLHLVLGVQVGLDKAPVIRAIGACAGLHDDTCPPGGCLSAPTHRDSSPRPDPP